MPIKLEDLKRRVAFDQSEAIRSFECGYKGLAQVYLDAFDFESSRSRKDIKHYPINDLCEDDPESLNKCLENIADALWVTFIQSVKEALDEANIDFDPLTVLAGGDLPSKKLGKIRSCATHRFSYVNTDVPTVQPYAFSYLNEDGKLEVMAEINFSVEVY